MRTAGRWRHAPLFLAAILLGGCPSKDYVHLYRSSPVAPSLDPAAVEAMQYLGPTIVDKGVNFGVYSEHASRIDLLLFDDPEATRPTREIEMYRFGDVWNLFVEGVGEGQHYGFVAWGPNWPFVSSWIPGSLDGFVADVDADGNRFNPNKLLLDPYAKALHRDHDWSKGSAASGPKRTEPTIAAASKSVVVSSKYAWSDSESAWRASRQDENFPRHRWTDLIVYEVHPKGFTASAASGVEHPGTFRGFGEKADYFADLGVTAVELLPVFQKPADGGYWGYQTLSFFTPELTYSSRTEPGEPIEEFKWMVDQLHQRGLEVILDVVYNHTGEGGLWREKLQLDDVALDPVANSQLVNFDPKEVAGIFCYRGLDNQAYYALTPDNQTYWNNTGVGNQTRPNHRPMRKLILDSLRYWVEEMHVDGFRFDLAPVLGEKDLDYKHWDDVSKTVLQDIVDDPVLQQYNTRVIAEPWSLAGDYGSQSWPWSAGGNFGAMVGGFPSASAKDGSGWYEWNGRFRDWWRSFANFDTWTLSSKEGGRDGGFFLTGSQDWYAWNKRRPYHSVNFVTVHDGFTLYDVFSYDLKMNKCGPLNPVCCEAPLSPFCDRDSGESNNRSRDWGQANEHFKRQQMRNLFVAMMISHGTPMILGGDEWMRTQLGNNNAYSTRADNPYNWFDWGTWQANDERNRMHDFVRKLTRFRASHGYAFAPAQFGQAAPFSWKDELNQNAGPSIWAGKHLALHFYDASKGPQLEVLINMEVGWVDFQLPQLAPGQQWRRLIDTQSYFDLPGYFASSGASSGLSANIALDTPPVVSTVGYNVPGHTIVVLEAR